MEEEGGGGWITLIYTADELAVGVIGATSVLAGHSL